ncbi:uncharacterized protein MEPE_03825 [Melanopsichium pennsylvanicum]|uniref:Chondroitin AC/alginate lyase n=2 Tax=Melanopsichium pennsylvanicum TaxID=63383 RepID=A0AAJ4XNJ8_9BASI|nr:uncharacterized protein BN887_05729 [Melanopsichium pennsylvanicum 4]SNX85116.1 uncharacterized protein MEPE_03825 [Melanopsichium pennsylvanicum]
MIKLYFSLLFFVVANVVHALVRDVPGLNGPIPPTNLANVKYYKKRPNEFQHPGLWHTHDDLERMRIGVASKQEPWYSAFSNFSTDSYSLSSYKMKGPYPVISRGGISNYTSFTSDARAAWQNALMWYITRDPAHHNVSTSILDGWGSNLTDIIGTDRSLLLGTEGLLFVNAAEIMRWEGNWTETGASWRGGSGFSVQLYWLFARQSIPIGQANYGMASIAALLNYAVYLEDVSMYNYALDMLQNDPCAGFEANFDTRTGQNGESGRDQGHAQVALGWTSLAAKTILSQGGDMWRDHNNLLLRGAEYAGAYNANRTVSYDPSFYRCEAVLVNGPWQTIANISRGLNRPVYDLIYYQYRQRLRIKSKTIEEIKQLAPSEGHVTSADLPSWGDLLWPYNATA